MVSGLGYVFTDDGGKPRRRLQRLVAALYRAGVSRAGAVFVFNRDDRAEMLRHGILRSDQKVVQVPGSGIDRSEEHTSELQPLMRISYAVFCLKKKTRGHRKDHLRRFRTMRACGDI